MLWLKIFKHDHDNDVLRGLAEARPESLSNAI